ncbi:MAG: hypothetical protein NXI32_16060 [bacterium]|nr:hypothetical protein [bacterium]
MSTTLDSALPAELPRAQCTGGGKRVIVHTGHQLEADLESIMRVHKSPAYCPHCQVPYPRIRKSGFGHPIAQFILRLSRRRCFRCMECNGKFVVRGRKTGWQNRVYAGKRYTKQKASAY